MASDNEEPSPTPAARPANARKETRARFPDQEVTAVVSPARRDSTSSYGSARPANDRHASGNDRLSRAFESLNERTPLLDTAGKDAASPSQRPTPPMLDTQNLCQTAAGEETKSTLYIFMLVLGIGGLQLAWAVELSNGSPYLLSLGISKAVLAFVWIAGPLSGTLVQPYVGMKSDNCRVSWGKRKPFIIGGAIATIATLLLLAWAREIVHGIAAAFGANVESKGVANATAVFAVLIVYILDFAINTIQAAVRAFIVDGAPAHQQEQANAWAGRLTGVGNIIGYLAADANLPKIFWFLGDTQFKVLAAIACIALASAVTASTSYVKERDPRLDGPPQDTGGIFDFFGQIFTSMKRMPPQIRKVCEVQFFNWIGWFPFLFYITTYIGQLQVNPIFREHPNLPDEDINRHWEDATRTGSRALLIFAITSFSTNMLLPFIVAPSYRPPPPQQRPARTPRTPRTPGGGRPRLHRRQTSTMNAPRTPGTPGQIFFPPLAAPENKTLASRFFSALQIKWLTLRRAWIASHILFFFCMMATFFVDTAAGGIVIVGVVGLSWALSLWAPFALISAEISKRDAARRARWAKRALQMTDDEAEDEEAEAEDQAGVILGLHNVAIASPQVIATLVSSLIFNIFQKPRGVPGDESTSWVLRFGGLAALIAAYMTYRVEEESEIAKEEESEA